MTRLEPRIVRRLVCVVASIVFASALMLGATESGADPNSDCYHEIGLDLKIRGCTQIIERGEQESLKSRVRAYNHRGFAHIQKREYDAAIADFTKAIALIPSFIYAYNNRGSAYAAKRQLDHAIADYTKAISLNPNYAEAYGNLGGAYERKGELDRAIAGYTKAIAIKPNFASFFTERGKIYAAKGETAKAEADLAKAEALGLAANAKSRGQWSPANSEVELVRSQTHAYFSAKDSGHDDRKAYGFFSEQLRGYLPFDKFQSLSQQFHARSGSVRSRQIKKVTWYRNPKSAKRPGTYAAVDFISTFENIDIHCGYLVWHQQSDGSYLLTREEQNFLPRGIAEELSPVELSELKAKLGC